MSTIMKALEKANREKARDSSEGSWQQALNNHNDLYAADILKRRRQMRTLSQIVIGMGLIAGVSTALLAVLILWLLNNAGSDRQRADQAAGRSDATLRQAPPAEWSDRSADADVVGWDGAATWRRGEGLSSSPEREETAGRPGRKLSSRILDSGVFNALSPLEVEWDDNLAAPILGAPEVPPPSPAIGIGREEISVQKEEYVVEAPAYAPPTPSAPATPVTVPASAPADAPPALPDLAGIMWTDQNPFAFIDGQTVLVGDYVSGYKVLEITRHTVLVESPEGRRHTLRP